MKKIILSVLWLFFINVNAETFYTDYSLVSENNIDIKEEYNGDELKKVERKEGYNNYQEVISKTNYYELGKAPKDYNNYDLEDSIIKYKYANYPYNNDYEYSTLRIRTYSNVRFIVLRSFITNAKLNNIEITYDNNLINYNIYKTNYNFNDKLYKTSNIVLDLGKKYDLDKLELILTFEDDTFDEISFMLDIYSGNIYNYTNPNVYYYNTFYRNNNIEKFKINFLSNDNFNALLNNLNWIRYNDYDSLNAVSYYSKELKLYKYYAIKKDYLNVYTTEPIDGYMLDYNDKKDLYDYYERDFIEVKDEINNIDDIDNIVISSSLSKDRISIQIKSISDSEVLLIISANDSKFFKKVSLKNDCQEIIENDVEDNKDSELINLNSSKDIINKSLEVNDYDFFKVNTDEIIIEKDFSNYKEDYTNSVKNNDDTIALLINHKEDKKSSIKANKPIFNYKIILLILLLCVKFFTLFKKKKSSFVEDV